MIARRREKRVIDALDDLTVYLRGLREERKAVLAISDGWLLFRENRTLARHGRLRPAAEIGQVGIGPDGRITTDTRACAGLLLPGDLRAGPPEPGPLDNWQTFMDLLDRANRANVSFYPIDSRGLPAFDSSMRRRRAPLHRSADAQARIEKLRTLADATDGLAVVNNNDIERGMQRSSTT